MCCPKKSVRELRVDSGKLTQCLACQTLGFDIGTVYFSLSCSELEGFLKWYSGVIALAEMHPRREEKTFLRIERSRVLLALTEKELEDLGKLLRAGLRWTVSRPLTLAEHAVSSSVH